MEEYKCKINITGMIDNLPYINEDIKKVCLQKLDNGFMNYMNIQN